ncbi:MAG: hypothetical protein H7124_07955 [Phycisphaerales bacterium]|nr:hypothetical protein [Hyphomonadaceae bacterium]
MTAAGIITMKESAAAALALAETAVTTRAKQAVRPIYINDGDDPEHYATCTFITVDEQDYLVTCAHVIDVSSKKTTLFVGIGKTHEITAIFGITKAQDGDRENDLIDFAFTPVGAEWRQRGIIPFAPEEMKIPKAHFYCAYGYPNSRNGKKSIDFIGKKIRPTTVPFISVEVTDPDVLVAAEINTAQHLALLRDPKGFNGQKPFDPVGTSGGAILAMHDLAHPDVLAGKKAPRVGATALITHKNKANKLLVGTRLTTIVAAIRSAKPHS